MWVHAGHPGWGRLAIALALGPMGSVIPFIFLEDNPLEALFVLLFRPAQDFTQTATHIAYPVSLFIGLPIVLALAKRGNAGFIPVVSAGAALGLVCWLIMGELGGGFMFLGSLGASSCCWLIAFCKNPRARVPAEANVTGRASRLT